MFYFFLTGPPSFSQPRSLTEVAADSLLLGLLSVLGTNILPAAIVRILQLPMAARAIFREHIPATCEVRLASKGAVQVGPRMDPRRADGTFPITERRMVILRDAKGTCPCTGGAWEDKLEGYRSAPLIRSASGPSGAPF